MICNKCNHKLPDDSEFCQYCGDKIEKQEILQEEIVENRAKDVASPNEDTKMDFLDFEGRQTTPNNIIHNTPKATTKKKNTFISFANISSIILSALSIVITICLMSIGDEIDDFIIFKSISMIAYTVFLVFAVISLVKKRFKLLTGLSFVLSWIIGILEFPVAWEYHYYYPYTEDVKVWGEICFIITIIIFLIMLFPTSVTIANAIKNSWHQSVRYHEKCYKRIAKMHTYLEKGIISHEEYEKVRSEILKNIN